MHRLRYRIQADWLAGNRVNADMDVTSLGLICRDITILIIPLLEAKKLRESALII